METTTRNAIGIDVDARYVEDQSQPEEQRFVFAYTIRVRNEGDRPARLLGRHWIITDARGQIREVDGEGVVGEQPWIEPGQVFQYTSGAVLETDLGIMRGSYRMLGSDGTPFEAAIPPFTLSVPRTLH